LDKWRKDDTLDEKVEVAATYSITLTAGGFDLRGFNEASGVRPDET
jgi:hypothetical protein